MPKMKTSRAAAKRFKLTKKGKVKQKHCFTSHILTKKSRKRKRNLRKTSCLSAVEAKRVKKLLPYG